MDGKRKIKYRSKRLDDPAAAFKAEWNVGKALPQSQPGSREFFLTERYMLYTEFEGELLSCSHLSRTVATVPSGADRLCFIDA